MFVIAGSVYLLSVAGDPRPGPAAGAGPARSRARRPTSIEVGVPRWPDPAGRSTRSAASWSRRYGVAAGRGPRGRGSPYRVCPLGAHVDHQLGAGHGDGARPGRAPGLRPVAGSPRSGWPACDFPGDVQFSARRRARPAGRRLGRLPPGRGGRRCGKRTALTGGLVGVIFGQAPGRGRQLVGGRRGRVPPGPRGRQRAARLARSRTSSSAGGSRTTTSASATASSTRRPSSQSRRGHLTRIDCRTVRPRADPRRAGHAAVPDPAGLLRALKAALVGTDYNRRVEECAEAARDLLDAAGRAGAGPSSATSPPSEYDAHKGRLRDAPARRAAHFFAEVDAGPPGRRGLERPATSTRFGALMTASGESSIRNYECGSPAADRPVSDARRRPTACYGARFSGAGFRGCCVALVEPEAAEPSPRGSPRSTPRAPRAGRARHDRPCETADGAAIVARPLDGRGRSVHDAYPLARVP